MNQPDILVSDTARDRILSLKKEKSISEEAILRIEVVSGGCSGLSYQMDFTEGLSQDQKDRLIESNGVKLAVDMKSFLYLAGSMLDFSEGLQGKGFHFANPNASRTCSCGESFSL